MMNKAIFFDRDGVVNYRIVGEYITSPENFVFMPDFLYFFQEIKKAGYLAIITSNQQGIGKGLMAEEQLDKVHKYMQEKLKELTGFPFDDIFVCTELASANSHRRKPNPGMIEEAVEKWNIDIEQSWMIGDRASDVIAGKRGGLKTILLRCFSIDEVPEADFVIRNLYEAHKIKF
jgi:D-glycero-D-manno-heptose 1,7-bisphosphate phosphatase